MAQKYAVNCSIMFSELPLLERPAAAKAAGFQAVEFWWPFAGAVPDDAEADAFVAAVTNAGVELIGLNFFAGDMSAGDRGLVSWPGRETEFHDNVAAVFDLGQRLGCRAFNALYGNRVAGATPQAQDDIAVQNLAFAAEVVGSLGATVLVEPVSGSDGYPLLTAHDVFGVIDRVRKERGTENLGFLCDLYHLATNGDDLDRVIAMYGDRVSHVQIADAPGRHQPGTGDLDLARYTASLRAGGYDGWVALEYKPTGATADSFEWIAAEELSRA